MNKSGFLFIALSAAALFIAINVTAEDQGADSSKSPPAKTETAGAAGEETKAEHKGGATEAVEADPQGSKKSSSVKHAPPTPIAITMEAVKELEARKKNLDARELSLNERAKALDIQEKILREKLQRLEELSRKVAEKLDGYKAKHEEKVAKLVTVVEGMKPQSAAEYVENLEPDLAVEILTRINVQRAPKIMNLLDKKKGARLTELYAGYRDRQSMNLPQASLENKSKEGEGATSKP